MLQDLETQLQKCAERIHHSDVALVTATLALTDAEETMLMEKKRAEARFIQANGGDPKALGSNETERARNLELGISTDETYTQTVATWRRALETKMFQEVDIRAAQNEWERIVIILMAG